MRRRDLIIVGAAAATWSGAVRGQTNGPLRRIAVLNSTASSPQTTAELAAFRQGLEALGWMNGRNLSIEIRFSAGDADEMQAYATELAAMKPEAILCGGSATAAALKRASSVVPIVFVLLTDPVGQGLVASLAHPGGNITGFTNFESAMGGKWLELLKKTAPGIKRVAHLFNPETAPRNGAFYDQEIAEAARSMAIDAIAMPVHTSDEIDDALAGFARDGGGVLVLPDAFTATHAEQIVALANHYHAPAVYAYQEFAAEGGLVAYGPDRVDIYRQAASYIARILKGEEPANLPVQGPTKFDLVVNLKTAKALDLAVPQSLLATADQVIE